MENLIFKGEVFILGNQAADLDSTASALSLAALLEALNPGLKAHPLIQGAPEDLRLKPEIPALLKRCGLDLKDEHFLKAGSSLPKDSNVILVDHNSPDFPGLENSVRAIMDHHRDDGFLTDLPLRVIERTGSCATLVAELWQQSGLDISRQQSLLLLAAIVIDTGDLNPEWGKATAKDRKIYESLSAGLGDDDLNFVRSLLQIKLDLSHLSLLDQLRRDFKLFPYSGFRAGISSVPMMVDEFFAPGFFDSGICGSFMKENCPDLLMIMHSSSDPFRRQFSFYSDPDREEGSPSPATQIKSSLESLGGFTPLPSPAADWHSYDQEDPKLSRKVLAPLLKDRLEQISIDFSEQDKTIKRGES